MVFQEALLRVEILSAPLPWSGLGDQTALARIGKNSFFLFLFLFVFFFLSF